MFALVECRKKIVLIAQKMVSPPIRKIMVRPLQLKQTGRKFPRKLC